MAKTTNITLPDGSIIQVPAWATETTLVAMAQQYNVQMFSPVKC